MILVVKGTDVQQVADVKHGRQITMHSRPYPLVFSKSGPGVLQVDNVNMIDGLVNQDSGSGVLHIADINIILDSLLTDPV